MRFLLTDDRMVQFEELFVDSGSHDPSARRLQFNHQPSLSRASVKKVFKLRSGKIGKPQWAFYFHDGTGELKIGCMKFVGSNVTALKAWIAGRR